MAFLSLFLMPPLYYTYRRLSTLIFRLSGEDIKIVFGTPLVQPDTRFTFLRGVLHGLDLSFTKARGGPTGDADFADLHECLFPS